MDQGLTAAPLLEARFGLDGGAMFGIVPRPLWSKTNPPDDANRIELGARCLLLRHPQAGNVLVDVGIGQKWDPKGQQIYKIRHDDPAGPLGLAAGLAAHGLRAEDIDHVVLTHLHFDHAGGLTRRDPSGTIKPTFSPRTQYHLQAQHWAWAHNPTERDQGSFHREDFDFLEDPDLGTLRLYDGVAEVLPGVTLIPCFGHTTAMSCVKIEARDETLLFLADLIPTTGHLKIPYVMGYDLRPMETCREKRALLDEAARHDWRLVFEHDPDTASCRVEPDGRGAWRAIPESAR